MSGRQKLSAPSSPGMRFSSTQLSAARSLQAELEYAQMLVEQESADIYSAEIASFNSDIIPPVSRPYAVLRAKSAAVVSSETSSGVGTVTPATDGIRAMCRYRQALTPYELKEIVMYTDVYFVGRKAVKTNEKALAEDSNHGFDDGEDFYKFTAHDHIDYRYEMLKVLGTGAFGQVIKAFDHKENRHVALKIMKNTDKSIRLCLQESRMMQLLVKLDVHKEANMTALLRSFKFRNHMIMVMDVCAMDLYTLLCKRKDRNSGFSMPVVRKFALGLLRTLRFMERQDIIHCDLKLENILLMDPSRTGVKLCDFNTSCRLSERLYGYIQSRYYRAPEVVLRIKEQQYGPPMDMWSLGCIIAELQTGQILFPGGNEADMVALFCEMLGLPPASLLERCSSVSPTYFHEGNPPIPTYCTSFKDSYGRRRLLTGAVVFKRMRGRPGTKCLAQFFDMAENTPFVDFVRQCLDWNPDTRLKASEAFSHPWILNRYPE
ncbi:Dual specificity tyrosine-phosphorylation-regulated kinase 2 [Hypsibius exemplaris]|uniref:dual-specificity kinase n=1 Tax=Hypsibius exemplaris TaxID=2072580 RepID=A0A1W0X2S6_HYPEX|nr:Dual specificity tyrosine-phosphorylation-regulated kinase 2 [Hypsibius exemplaris]